MCFCKRNIYVDVYISSTVLRAVRLKNSFGNINPSNLVTLVERESHIVHKRTLIHTEENPSCMVLLGFGDTGYVRWCISHRVSSILYGRYLFLEVVHSVCYPPKNARWATFEPIMFLEDLQERNGSCLMPCG